MSNAAPISDGLRPTTVGSEPSGAERTALRDLAKKLGMSASDAADARPWSEGAVAAYAANHGQRDKLLLDWLPDVQIASAVRMLMRDDIDHEAIVQAARDRICALHVEKMELLSALQGVVAVADRKTVEFDAARAAIAKALGDRPEGSANGNSGRNK